MCILIGITRIPWPVSRKLPFMATSKDSDENTSAHTEATVAFANSQSTALFRDGTSTEFLKNCQTVPFVPSCTTDIHPSYDREAVSGYPQV